MAFAEATIRLSMKDGPVTLRAQLEQGLKAWTQLAEREEKAGRPIPPRPEGLDLLEVPEISADAWRGWQWWLELHAVRGSNGFGPGPITHGMIGDWRRETGARPSPLYVDMILAVDDIFAAVYGEHADRARVKREAEIKARQQRGR